MKHEIAECVFNRSVSYNLPEMPLINMMTVIADGRWYDSELSR